MMYTWNVNKIIKNILNIAYIDKCFFHLSRENLHSYMMLVKSGMPTTPTVSLWRYGLNISYKNNSLYD